MFVVRTAASPSVSVPDETAATLLWTQQIPLAHLGEKQSTCWCARAGLTLTEAQNINRSLLELGNVISALMQQAAHVPYRCMP